MEVAIYMKKTIFALALITITSQTLGSEAFDYAKVTINAFHDINRYRQSSPNKRLGSFQGSSIYWTSTLKMQFVALEILGQAL